MIISEIKTLLNTDPLNAHQVLWEASVSETNQDLKQKLRLAAGILGHYRAISASSEQEQKILVETAETNQRWQNWKQILVANKGDVNAFRKLILEKNLDLIKWVFDTGSLPDKKQIMSIMNIKNRPVTWLDRLLCHIRKKLMFFSNLVLGSNNYLEKSASKRAEFDHLLTAAETGSSYGSLNPDEISNSVSDQLGSHKKNESVDHRLTFQEVRTENNKGHILEMLKISKPTTSNNKSRGKKDNIVIYIGGHTDNFAFSTKHVLNQVWALDAIDQFWHINPRHVSLSAGLVSPNYANLVTDAQMMYEYIKQRNPDANITLYGMCGGSPVACKVAKKEKVKFFSDRSFQTINDVVDVQIDSSWYTFVVSLLLFPLRYIRYFYMNIRGLNPKQNVVMEKIDPKNRDCHAVMPSKHLKIRVHDNMTKGTKVSLHESSFIKKENKAFDTSFIAICRLLLGEESSGSIENVKKKDMFEAVKVCRDIDPIYVKLLEAILAWHKDRKSFLDADDTRRSDPHVLWPSKLKGRYTKANPMWRLNLLASTTAADLGIKNKDLLVLAEYANPVALALSGDIKMLDRFINSRQSSCTIA